MSLRAPSVKVSYTYFVTSQSRILSTKFSSLQSRNHKPRQLPGIHPSRRAIIHGLTWIRTLVIHARVAEYHQPCEPPHLVGANDPGAGPSAVWEDNK